MRLATIFSASSCSLQLISLSSRFFHSSSLILARSDGVVLLDTSSYLGVLCFITPIQPFSKPPNLSRGSTKESPNPIESYRSVAFSPVVSPSPGTRSAVVRRCISVCVSLRENRTEVPSLRKFTPCLEFITEHKVNG